MKNLAFACLAFVLAVPACGGGGLGINGSSCADRKDRDSCLADSACVPIGCPTCGGGLGFSGCYDKDNAPAQKCAAPPCPFACSGFKDAKSCTAAGCEVSGCPDCSGGTSFLGCYAPGDGPDLGCPAFCPQPACTQITDAAQCEGTSGCHGVYVDHQACACAQPGCCTTFDHCQDGAASCAPEPTPPSCTKVPVCEGDWVVDYNSGLCPTGCVRATSCNDCRSTGCDEGTCQPCWTTWECTIGPNEC